MNLCSKKCWNLLIMPWQCSFKKLCFFAPILPKIMLAQSAKAYSYSLHRWEKKTTPSQAIANVLSNFFEGKWTQNHPNTFRDCRVQFSDNLSRTSCTTSPSPFKRLPGRHRRVIGFYDVLETFNLRASHYSEPSSFWRFGGKTWCTGSSTGSPNSVGVRWTLNLKENIWKQTRYALNSNFGRQ